MNDTVEFIEGMSYEQFISDKKTMKAVLRSVEVIGEATKNVPDDIRARYQQVPWKEMAGMRDKVVHFYFGIDAEIIWLVIKDRIPAIKPMIERVLHNLEKQGK
jgi:uncharacterized protein with HEPN domain